MKMDERIVKFIKKHHVLTVATCVDNKPWTANCFYAYMEEENCFVFTTDDDTRHGLEFMRNPVVAGSVVLETNIIGKIRGLQFEGLASKPDEALYKKVKKAYLRRFPVAMLMDTNLWIISLTQAKLTDNRLGFGKKLRWSKP
ncbi:MAG: pyridoxamine 5'-phosphate oxidase family protein [Bacteroidales bacterium]|nr:pyridoxamine 5'-phosphate oxidase family protein [Bacteroidales bacterium]